MTSLPRWADTALVPLFSLALSLMVAGLMVLWIGENPFHALGIMLKGAVGTAYGWGYTLYYATNFIFTGLAVAVAIHAGLFNIGAEGQATVGGLGAALVCLSLEWPHWSLALPAAVCGAALFGAAWAAVPAYLQARHGSHIVITTIMFNIIASALLVYLLVNVLRAPGQIALETASFPPGAHLPTAHEILGWMGIGFPKSPPLNISLLLALAGCMLVWVLIWRTRLGYEIRTFGFNESAAIYAGISPFRIVMTTLLISGGLAGLMAINTVMGEAERLLNNAVQGAGFVGIAVALMGRSHPVGILLASVLFGILYQGGAELEFHMPAIDRDMVIFIQALVILFVGALDSMVRFPAERLLAFIARTR